MLTTAFVWILFLFRFLFKGPVEFLNMLHSYSNKLAQVLFSVHLVSLNVVKVKQIFRCLLIMFPCKLKHYLILKRVRTLNISEFNFVHTMNKNDYHCTMWFIEDSLNRTSGTFVLRELHLPWPPIYTVLSPDADEIDFLLLIQKLLGLSANIRETRYIRVLIWKVNVNSYQIRASQDVFFPTYKQVVNTAVLRMYRRGPNGWQEDT